MNLLWSATSFKCCLYISLVVPVLFYIIYCNFDRAESVYTFKLLSCVYIILEIIFKLTNFSQAYDLKGKYLCQTNPFELPGLGSEGHFSNEFPLSLKSKSKLKTNVLISSLNIFLLSVVSVIVTHFVVILFGAYVIEEFEETFTFSLLFATFVLIRPLINFGSAAVLVLCEDWSLSNTCQVQGLFVLFGAWLGASTIPLDWDRPWQVWPIPCAFGGLLGEVASSFLLLAQEIRKPKKLV